MNTLFEKGGTTRHAKYVSMIDSEKYREGMVKSNATAW
jgi:hypothetical protein